MYESSLMDGSCKGEPPLSSESLFLELVPQFDRTALGGFQGPHDGALDVLALQRGQRRVGRAALGGDAFAQDGRRLGRGQRERGGTREGGERQLLALLGGEAHLLG